MNDLSAVDYFETAKQIVRDDAAKRLAKVKRRPRPDFETVVYVIDKDGQDWEIRVGICYDATYQPAKLYGPPEDCYPDESEMDLTELVILDDLPQGITEDMVNQAADDDERLIEEAWEHYHARGEE